MVDKLWYDWQNANPINFWSFTGGSVAVAKGDPVFPNGAPPFMNVRNLLKALVRLTNPPVVLHVGPDGWYHERVYRL